jgi:uncharacterized protein (TIGR02145 family)
MKNVILFLTIGILLNSTFYAQHLANAKNRGIHDLAIQLNPKNVSGISQIANSNNKSADASLKEKCTTDLITDIEGNIYKTVKIGNQSWMAENLKATKYKDGTPIPNITGDSIWSISQIGAYYWYDNNTDLNSGCGSTQKGHSAHRLKDTSNVILQVPKLTTYQAMYITNYSAISGGIISSDGGSAITAKGICWNTSPNPDITHSKTKDGKGVSNYRSRIIGLIPNTTYYLRAYAINNAGVGYGNELSFTTLPETIFGSVTDVEGNIYKTVTIGNQNWMAENLKTTKYSDGSPISNVTANHDWSSLTYGAYCWYDNDEETYKNQYGALYNYFAVIDNRNICPANWHIPTAAEWTELRKCASNLTFCEEYHSYCSLKEAGTAHWIYGKNSNETGFTGLAGGLRQAFNGYYGGEKPLGTYRTIGLAGFFWQSNGNYFYLASFDEINLYNEWLFDHSYSNGYSVRCIENKDIKIHTSSQNTFRDSSFMMPIYSNNLIGYEAVSYQFDVTYDSQKIQYQDYSLEGTLSSKGAIQVNSSENKLSIAWAGQAALADSGILVKLKFKALECGVTSTVLSNFLVNTDTVKNITNGSITISPAFGDVDGNGHVQAFDAALVLQYSVGYNPVPDIDPIPWEAWKITAANVDGQDAISAYDASLILQYVAGLINSFPVQGYEKSTSLSQADVLVTIENGNIVFRSSGDLYGLNVTIKENSEVFGAPQILNTNALKASNITSSRYSVGMATAYAPLEGEIVLKIPITSSSVQPVILDLMVNNFNKQVNLGMLTGNNETIQKLIEMYPNPANTILYFRNLQGKTKITIYNLQGRMMVSEKLKDDQLDVSDLASGLYTVQIETEHKTITKKLMKR